MTRVAAWMLLTTWVSACGGARPSSADPAAPPPEYPGALVRPSVLPTVAALGDAFALQQRVRIEYPEGAQEFRAVLQKRADNLTLVGFGPHGGRGFVLQLEGEQVLWESHLPQELPFPPEFMLRDVERVWFLGLPGPRSDGTHREARDGEEIVEVWRDGRLWERTFRRLDDNPPGLQRVTYEEGLGSNAPPPRVTFVNAWFGYTLVLQTLSHDRLPAESTPE